MKKLFLLIILTSCQRMIREVTILPSHSPTDALLQAISVVDEDIAWVSGHNATFLRTTNGGDSWTVFQHNSDTLQFRDLHALDENRVILMSSGPGKASRIFRFSLADGWNETYVMPYNEGFLNSIEFWDNRKGIAFGDSFDGQLFVLKTTDGGMNWERIDPDKLPPAGEGEGGFASSGTCIATRQGGKAWIGTGAGGNARVLYTGDYGNTWSWDETPMIRGKMAGIFSIRMVTDSLGTISGGDLGTELPKDHLALTKNGGKTWTLVNQPTITGTIYGSALLQTNDQLLWVICGPNGMDFSLDYGQTWKNISLANHWAVELHEGFGYAAGTDGKISRISLVKE